MHEWKVKAKTLGDKTIQYYCYWSDKNNRKYSTWYYEPFKTEDTAYKWIREINLGRILFNTTSMTRTKYGESV